MSCPGGRKKLLGYAVPYWRKLTLVLVLSVLSTGLSLTLPYLSKSLVDRALLGRDSQALLQILDTLGQGRLGHMQRLGGACEVAFA